MTEVPRDGTRVEILLSTGRTVDGVIATNYSDFDNSWVLRCMDGLTRLVNPDYVALVTVLEEPGAGR